MIEVNLIITTASVITALVVIFSSIFSVYRWYLRQNRQDEEIRKLKEEQRIIVYGLLACLDGLKQLGANGNVTEAKNKIEKYINVIAHE